MPSAVRFTSVISIANGRGYDTIHHRNGDVYFSDVVAFVFGLVDNDMGAQFQAGSRNKSAQSPVDAVYIFGFAGRVKIRTVQVLQLSLTSAGCRNPVDLQGCG